MTQSGLDVAGYSFICDPAYGRPTDPAWIEYCKAILPVAQSLGARAGAVLRFPWTHPTVPVCVWLWHGIDRHFQEIIPARLSPA